MLYQKWRATDFYQAIEKKRLFQTKQYRIYLIEESFLEQNIALGITFCDIEIRIGDCLTGACLDTHR